MNQFELLNDNCLPILDKFISENRKVDCIITSPPYNMNLRVMKGKYVSRCNNKNHKIEFSTKYENYNDDLSMEYYFNFQKEFIEKALTEDVILVPGLAFGSMGREYVRLSYAQSYKNLEKAMKRLEKVVV